VTGAVLGIGTGAVAIAAGIRPMRANGYPSVAPDPTMLSDPAVRWCVLASLACFPLWTLIGVAIGRLLRRGALLAVVVAVLCQPVTLDGENFLADLLRGSGRNARTPGGAWNLSAANQSFYTPEHR
jgi:hypothetical protein